MTDGWDVATRAAAWFGAAGTLLNAWFNYRKHLAEAEKELPLIIWEAERSGIGAIRVTVLIENRTPRPIYLETIASVDFSQSRLLIDELTVGGDHPVLPNACDGTGRLSLRRARVAPGATTKVIFRAQPSDRVELSGAPTEFTLDVDLGHAVERRHSFMFSRRV